MDDRRFDALTRTLGRGGTRRNVLAGAIAAAIGALGLGHTRSRAAAQDGPRTNPCDGVRCRAGSTCCNDCGTARCLPLTKAGCPRRPCPAPTPAPNPCLGILCGPGRVCCPTCGGICVPVGTDCPGIVCPPAES